MQLVDRSQDRVLPRTPAIRDRVLAESLKLVLADARPAAEANVMLPLVFGPPQVRHAQDHELRVAPRQLAARHQATGESQPAPQQRTVAPDRREQVRRPRADHAPRNARGRPGQDPQVLAIAGRDPRTGHRVSTCGSSGWGVVSGACSARAIASASLSRRWTAASTNGCTSIRSGRSGAEEAGATTQRDRRAIPRSSASSALVSGATRMNRSKPLVSLAAASVPNPRLVMSVSISAKYATPTRAPVGRISARNVLPSASTAAFDAL